MTPAELQAKLNELRVLPSETEWVEFKRNDQGEETYHIIGETLSAIANSLVLLRRDRGYLIWGVDNATHDLVGTDFYPRLAKKGNEELENWMTRLFTPQISFWIHELDLERRHFVLIEVGPAKYSPVRFSGEEYIRIGSQKRKLKDYPEKERELWRRFDHANLQDWSAQVCNGALLSDLDPQAIAFARQEYKKKHNALAAEVDQWSDTTFLNKAKVCVNEKITRAAIILLGKNATEHFLSPAVARISWILKDANGIEKDYQHFSPPLILAVDQVFAKIRNLTYRYLPNISLFPTEISQYDPWVIRETLHNCIAHQDYTQTGRINVVEEPESLLFTNLGDFLPGSVEEVIRRDAPSELYRNWFLAEAMINLNMIDTIGSGIKRMFTKQRQRNFPMPDFDLSQSKRVKVRISGKVIDENYTKMLIARTDLDLIDVIALDKVQKSKELTEDEFRSLKAKSLIEGRRPNLFVSAEIAAATETKADYIKKRAFDKDHYKKMVIAYLEKFHEGKRQDLNRLLFDKLSDVLSDQQKENLIKNLLQEMRREESIQPAEGKRGMGAKWVLSKSPEQ